jgi:PIN domain nuclease of toxin-antitoxin system
VKLLLDSHAFLWWLAGDPKLAAGARQAVADPASTVHVSAATVWELSIKASRHHEDPFDRMLVAQAQIEGLTIVTRDPAFRAYGIAIVST